MKLRTLFFLIILFAFAMPVISQEHQTQLWDGKARPNIQQMTRLLSDWQAQGKTQAEISELLSGIIPHGGSGFISGTVFQSDGQTPMSSYSYINVYDQYGIYEGYDYVSTGDTTYSVGNLAPGLHYVQADVNGNYLDEFYNGTNDWRQATLVETFNDSTVSGIKFQIDLGKVIKGKVLDASSFNPLAGRDAYFYLYDEDALSDQDYYKSYGLLIGEDGSYYLQGIPTANYKLRITMDEYASQFYNNKSELATADVIHITGETDTLGFFNFLMGPVIGVQDGYEQNSVYEDAYEFDIGDVLTPQINPAGDIDFFTFMADSADTVDILLEAKSIESRLFPILTLYDSSGVKTLGQWGGKDIKIKKEISAPAPIGGSTDINVKYQMLPYAGRYFLRVSHSNNLEGGDEFIYNLSVNYSVYIAPTYGFISGGVYMGNDTTPYNGSSSYTLKLYNSEGSYYGGYVPGDPTYILSNIPSGSYKLYISVPNEGYLSEWYEDAVTIEEATEIVVVDSATHIDFILDPSGGISGRIFLENLLNDYTHGGYIYLYSTTAHNQVGESYYISPDETGLFSVSGIRPGDYNLRFVPSEDYPDVWYGDVGSQGNAASLNVAAGDTTDNITMIVKRGGLIQGFVKMDDQSVSNDTLPVNIIAYDEAGFIANDFTHNTFSGGYRTPLLYPGTYKLQALAQSSNLASWYYKSGIIFDDIGSQTVEVKSDSAHEIPINLSMANGSISGTVFNEDGVTSTNQPGMVYAYDETGHMVQSTFIGVDPQTGQLLEKGQYRISGLKGGIYYLMLILNANLNLLQEPAIAVPTEKSISRDIIKLRVEPITLKWYPDIDVISQNTNQLYFQGIPEGAITVDVTESQNTGGRNFNGVSTSISTENKTILPNQFVLSAVYPNPFNPSTTLTYRVANKSRVKIEIFDMLGRKVATVLDEVKSSGWHNVKWNGRNSLDQMVGSGLYIARLQAAGIQSSKKMLLIR